jgi:hypothetical protein
MRHTDDSFLLVNTVNEMKSPIMLQKTQLSKSVIGSAAVCEPKDKNERIDDFL